MFKITTNNENPEFNTVNLCGRFTREYVPEVEKALFNSSTTPKILALDLAEVTVVDRTAIMFLCAARAKNVAIQNAPLFVGLWMDQEECQGPLQSN